MNAHNEWTHYSLTAKQLIIKRKEPKDRITTIEQQLEQLEKEWQSDSKKETANDNGLDDSRDHHDASFTSFLPWRFKIQKH